MNTYKTELENLNTEQKKAAQHIEGPLLVIAGPGTGKTQLLSARVANILSKTDTAPQNIVCLTFTNKATDNMKKRLFDLIGVASTHVEIKTFHGLAAEIMNRHPEYFWRGAHLSIAPDAVQLETMQQVLLKLPTEHPLTLKFAGQFTLIDDVNKAIGLVKEAGLTPDKLRSIIFANLAYIDAIEPLVTKLSRVKVGKNTLQVINDIVEGLPLQPIDQIISPLVSLHTVISESFERALAEVQETGKTTPVSKWKTRWLQKDEEKYGMFDERKRNDWWLGVADAYEKYRQQIHTKGYYDYADMLVEVIYQIEHHTALRSSLQEQFHYVLIDEFQDTNAAQLRLAQLIAEHRDMNNPNLMAVGDDDQSIFKFQGAELSNMLSFTRNYKIAKQIVLTDNYRSTQEVLDCASSVIDHAQYRLIDKLPNLSKKLLAKAPPSRKGDIKHLAYPSREEQLSDMSDKANQLLKSGKTVAILARKHASLSDIAGILHQKHVPISYERSNNILEQPSISELNNILRILTHIKKGEISQVSHLLSQSLAHPMWILSTKTLWRFATDQQTRHDWYVGLLESKDKKLQNIGLWLDWLVKRSASEPLAVVLEYVIGLRPNEILESPINRYFLHGDSLTEKYIETLSAVQLLRSLVGEFRSSKIYKVEGYVDFINLMEKNGKVISDSSPFTSGDKSVELLTVHKAKGLEFDAVIIIDAVQPQWSPRARGRVPPANLPLRPPEDDSDDYVRLMYVAASRSKHTLLFGSYLNNSKGESLEATASLSKVPVSLQKPKKGKELVQVLEQNLRWPELDQNDEYSILKPRLDDFVLNVSNLINFLDITKGGPACFKERNLLRLPQAKSSSASMGSAVHSALEEAQHQVNLGSIKFKDVLKTYEEALLSEGLPEDDYKKKLGDGKQVLERFMDTHKWQFSKVAKPEYKVTDVVCGNAKLGGMLDVLDISPNGVLITDYKTGRPLSSLNSRSASEGVKAWRHKLQLIFYALLVDSDPAIKGGQEVITQMVYVESSSKSKLALSCSPSREDLDRLSLLVQAVWGRIIKLDLPDVSKYSQDLKGIEQFEEDLIGGDI